MIPFNKRIFFANVPASFLDRHRLLVKSNRIMCVREKDECRYIRKNIFTKTTAAIFVDRWCDLVWIVSAVDPPI